MSTLLLLARALCSAGASGALQEAINCTSGGGTNQCKCQNGYTPYVDPRSLDPSAPTDSEATCMCYPTCTYCYNEYCFHYTDTEIRCVKCSNQHVLLERSCWKEFEFGFCNIKHEGDQIVPVCLDCKEGYTKLGNGCYRSVSRGMCLVHTDSYGREREYCYSCRSGWMMSYGDCICAGFGTGGSCLSAGTAVAISVICTMLICLVASVLVIYFVFIRGGKARGPKANPSPKYSDGASLLSTPASFI